MDEDLNISTEKISKINAAGLINLTLKDLWDAFYKHLRNLEYDKANSCLDCLWVEFAGDVESEGKEEKEIAQIDLELAENYVKLPKILGFKKPLPEDMILLARQYKLLMKKGVFLKRLQNKQGKGTAYHDTMDEYTES